MPLAVDGRAALRTLLWLGMLIGDMPIGCATGIGRAPRAAWTPNATTSVPVSMANELGLQARLERRFDRAAALLAQAADASPDLAEAWNGWAVALAFLGRLSAAQAAVETDFARGQDSDDLRANHKGLLRHHPPAVVATASTPVRDTTPAADAVAAAADPVVGRKRVGSGGGERHPVRRGDVDGRPDRSCTDRSGTDRNRVDRAGGRARAGG